ncbi:uncharacterized protein LOC112126193 [Cimex lectularius]|uniref:Uncharacterized protein n=1 Tax=Cimex lectularius TaxID=79782 RepID=A0A8I6TIB3_CIMLE|nr:uncharacterized protein LOC112126193 [Cimex lectularius]
MLKFTELNVPLIFCAVATALLTNRPTIASDEGTVIYLKGETMKRFNYNPWAHSRRQMAGPSPRVEASNYKILDPETPQQMGLLSQKYENIDLLPRMPGRRSIRQILRSHQNTKRPKMGNRNDSRTTLVDVTPEFIVYKRLFGRGTSSIHPNRSFPIE